MDYKEYIAEYKRLGDAADKALKDHEEARSWQSRLENEGASAGLRETVDKVVESTWKEHTDRWGEQQTLKKENEQHAIRQRDEQLGDLVSQGAAGAIKVADAAVSHLTGGFSAQRSGIPLPTAEDIRDKIDAIAPGALSAAGRMLNDAVVSAEEFLKPPPPPPPAKPVESEVTKGPEPTP